MSSFAKVYFVFRLYIAIHPATDTPLARCDASPRSRLSAWEAIKSECQFGHTQTIFGRLSVVLAASGACCRLDSAPYASQVYEACIHVVDVG